MSKPILIVEDDEIARVGLSAILQADGYETVTAVDGREALAQLEGGLEPALILLDMILPRCDGWQFCARRQSIPGGSAPFMIMTGLGIASDEWASSMGAVGLLRKPLDLDHLLATIRKYVRARGEDATDSGSGSGPA